MLDGTITSTDTYQNLEVILASASIRDLQQPGEELVLPLASGNYDATTLALLGNIPLNAYIDGSTLGRTGDGEKTRPADVKIAETYYPVHQNSSWGDLENASATPAASLDVGSSACAVITSIHPALSNTLSRIDNLTANDVHAKALQRLRLSGSIRSLSTELAGNEQLALRLADELAEHHLLQDVVYDRRKRPIQRDAGSSLELYTPSIGRDGIVFPTIGLLAFRLCKAQMERGRASLRVLADNELFRLAQDSETMAALGAIVARTMGNVSPVTKARITFVDTSRASKLVSEKQQKKIGSQWDLLASTRSRKANVVSMTRSQRKEMLGPATPSYANAV
jgi:hypothetical protein